MKIKYMLSAAALATLTLMSAAVHAEDQKTVSIEQNADGSTTTTTRYYYDRDANNNGILDSQEFPAYVYSRFDRNGDGFLDDSEWQVSSTRWYGVQPQYKTYKTWDKNADGRLDATEFDVVVTDSGLYKTWDVNADKTLESNEYAEATFRLYDENKDGNLSLVEWKAAQ